MKTIKSFPIFCFMILLVLINGCVADDDFSVPDTSISDPVLEGPEISIAAVAGQLAQEQGNDVLDYTDEQTIYTYEFNTQAQYLVGYVIASDEGGNFFEEILIQDRPENPTIGIKILIDVNPLSIRYEPGRKVYLQLNGLSTGITNGVLTVGLRNGNEVDNISAALENNVLQRSPEIEEIVPMTMQISEFSNNKTNMFVRVEDVQFNQGLVLGDRPLTYASESFDQFDGDRILESCESNTATIFSTSTFSDFKSLSLPTGRGYVDAILTKDFFGEVFNLRVNTPEDVVFDNSNRCDLCDGESGGGTEIFFEDFEDFGGFITNGWTNVNISGGSRIWTTDDFANNEFALISAFNANDDEVDVWLVTPGINLDNTTGEEFGFDVQVNFDDSNILTVFVSEDFTGDPTTATWLPVRTIIPRGPSNGFGSFEVIPPVNISCLSGTVHFGFFYQGSDPGQTTRYHIDNLRITGIQ
ncbi:MAG: DUF5689 domain-containing protein [Bacteroidota bacterium]